MTQQTVGQFVSLSGYFSEAWLYKCKNFSQLTVIHIKTMTMQTGISLSSYSHSDTRLLCRYRSILKTILRLAGTYPCSDTKLSRPNPDTTNCSTEPGYEDGFQLTFPLTYIKVIRFCLKNWPKVYSRIVILLRLVDFQNHFKLLRKTIFQKRGFSKTFP